MSVTDVARYVLAHAQRGECRCASCCDKSGDDRQPTGHTVDVIFFLVSQSGATCDELRSLVSNAKDGEYCWADLLDGGEHGFMEIGAWIGDQGLALTLMGLGAIIGLWDLLTPRTMIPGVDDKTAMDMAAAGLVTIMAKQIE